MKPEESYSVLDQATQPGVALNRQAYIHIEEALKVFKGMIELNNATTMDSEIVKEPEP